MTVHWQYITECISSTESFCFFCFLWFAASANKQTGADLLLPVIGHEERNCIL